jgi:hypothetical protein
MDMLKNGRVNVLFGEWTDGCVIGVWVNVWFGEYVDG